MKNWFKNLFKKRERIKLQDIHELDELELVGKKEFKVWNVFLYFMLTMFAMTSFVMFVGLFLTWADYEGYVTSEIALQNRNAVAMSGLGLFFVVAVALFREQSYINRKLEIKIEKLESKQNTLE